MAFIDDELEKMAETESLKVADNSFQSNASYANSAGLETSVDRSYDGVGVHNGKDPCGWCIERAGHWSYGDAYRNGVWERHEGCGCEIVYNCAKGSMRQTDWRHNTWTDVLSRDKIAYRKEYNLPNAYFKTAHMTPENYAIAVDMWNELEEYPLPGKEKEWVYEMFDNNLTIEEKKSPLVNRPFGDYHYYAVNRGHNQYKIYDKRPIEGTDWMDEVMREVIGNDWKKYDF